MTARSHGVIGMLQRVDDRQVEHDHQSLHDDRAAEAAGERAGMLAEAAERRGQRLDALADPLRMDDGQRLQQAADALRAHRRPAR